MLKALYQQSLYLMAYKPYGILKIQITGILYSRLKTDFLRHEAGSSMHPKEFERWRHAGRQMQRKPL